MRQKGYVEAWVLAPAKTELRGGPGGAVNVRAVSVRTDGGFSRDVEIVETDEGCKRHLWVVVQSTAAMSPPHVNPNRAKVPHRCRRCYTWVCRRPAPVM